MLLPINGRQLRGRIGQSKRFHSDCTAATATLLSCFRLHQPVVPPTRQSNLHVRWLLADTTTEYKRCPICKCHIVHTHYRPVLRYVPKCLREVASARASLHVIIGRTSNSLPGPNEIVACTRCYATVQAESLTWVARGSTRSRIMRTTLLLCLQIDRSCTAIAGYRDFGRLPRNLRGIFNTLPDIPG